MRCIILAGWTGLVLLSTVGSVQGQWISLFQGRVYVGPPPHPFPLASDNGIPGSGAYAYNDYDWPSLRQALQTYGLFGRKIPRRPPPLESRAAGPAGTFIPSEAGAWPNPPSSSPREEVGQDAPLPPPRLLPDGAAR